MIISTTPTIQNHDIIEYKGLVFGEVVSGANIVRDFFASITDIIGGRSGSYERKISASREDALRELEENARKLGANAIIGVSFDYSALGTKSMFVIVATGTAVVIR
ncbi:hypothetical protein A6B43_01240 [Vespertiliibacter pulmonis]|uniref:UPF0145 protein EDC46_0634 n=1 Tax=Vespertiliibacter pulmonis TaxID=1443036 RepID=A0A3N4WJX5_9PAST|nr:YbjQ family protein [Vespertiliibacter pulmonis]QLB20261.1 hypothetical protein A6B43_01240 [Vespertiliibacter pulmonis]RPE86240.1 uncharacterized protein YbjQ (UPF0145 family) [Vespertiliibacter pulmonis]